MTGNSQKGPSHRIPIFTDTICAVYACAGSFCFFVFLQDFFLKFVALFVMVRQFVVSLAILDIPSLIFVSVRAILDAPLQIFHSLGTILEALGVTLVVPWPILLALGFIL